MAEDKKTISHEAGIPTEAPEQPSPVPDLADYRAAKAILNDLLDGARLPRMPELKEKRRTLAAQKKTLYADYRAAQQRMREAVAVKANIDHLLGLTDQRKNKEQER